MKFPQNLVLDYGNKNYSAFSKYWIFYFFNSHDLNFKNYSIFLSKLFFLNYSLNPFFSINKLSRMTLKKKIFNNFITYRKKKSKYKTKLSATGLRKTMLRKKVRQILSQAKQTTSKLNWMLFRFSSLNAEPNALTFFSKKLFDINFLKKEKIYTKLKYSRVPQYDIVSGGSAALLAGFLGFLICEKFGFELLDSGDFYFLFMYIVFLSFSFKLWTKLISFENINWNVFGFRWLNYYILTVFNFFKNIFN